MAGEQRDLLDSIADDDTVRRLWRELVEVRLPAVAEARRWPVRADHCFARILLDVTVDRPWREVIRPPAWRNTPVDVLARATALGEAVLAGEADLAMLDARSLRMRGKPPKRRPHPA